MSALRTLHRTYRCGKERIHTVRFSSAISLTGLRCADSPGRPAEQEKSPNNHMIRPCLGARLRRSIPKAAITMPTVIQFMRISLTLSGKGENGSFLATPRLSRDVRCRHR